MPVSAEMNPDIAKERENASFDPNEFAAWFYGNRQMLEMKRMVEKELYCDLDDPLEHEYLAYEDAAAMAVKQSVKAAIKLKDLQDRINPNGSEIFPSMMGGPVGSALMPAGNPLSVHFVMFTRALKGQGTPEQYEKFGRRADKCEIIGTYAQTELGHGTFLRGLETRADYDRQTEEFILNTPTLTSYKWWPGGLGQTVNYCIVVAQLYIDDEPKGVHMFVVPVRDEETHMPLPGIDVGEIGKKIGMNGVNNGFLGLKNVRIPRLNMLMKNQQVLPDGTYVKSPVSRLTYFPMVYVRCMVVFSSAIMLAGAATIAARYSVVRRQSPINPEEPEPQIIEHRTQQMKVIPEITTAIAYIVSAGWLYKLYEETASGIGQGNYSRLPELHALACTMKASCSLDSAFGVERLRQSCGGHGYLTAANLGNLFANASAACTYEGENSVLYMQVGKILLKTWDDVLEKKQLMPTLAYMTDCASWERFPKWTGTWDCLIKAMQYVATHTTRVAYESYQRRLKQGETQPEAVNHTGLELTQAAKLYGSAFVMETFLRRVTGPTTKANYSAELRQVLENLLELYLVHQVLRYLADILRFIQLTEDELSALQLRLEELLTKLRPDMVAICDGFDFHDCVLNSVLGCYDGNVYERIFESAKKSPLNQRPVPKSFELYLKPFMQKSKL